jgi:hypothetical protein
MGGDGKIIIVNVVCNNIDISLNKIQGENVLTYFNSCNGVERNDNHFLKVRDIH